MYKLTAHDKVLLDKRRPDLNRANRGLTGHIKWTVNGKRKVTGRRYNVYRSERDHKLYILTRRCLGMRTTFRGRLWPHPDMWFCFYHNIVSNWVRTNYYGEDK
jgi:hypothetical protein